MSQLSNNKLHINTSESEEEIDLRDIAYKYLRHWQWFILSGIIFLFLGLFVYLTLDRKYQISTAVLLKEEKSGGGANSPLGSLQDLGLLSTTNNIDNEIAVFSSPNLLKQVVQALELHTIYKEKGVFRDTEVYKSSPYYVSIPETNLDILRASIFLNIKRSEDAITVQIKYTTSEDSYETEEVLDKLPGYVELPDDLGRLFITYRPNTKEEDKDKEYKIIIQNPLKVAYVYAREIKVSSTTKQSSVLNISLNAPNIRKGMDLLSELVDVYNKNNVASNNEMAVNTSKFIDARILDISRELEVVEDDVEGFKKEHKITNIGAEAQVFVEQTSDIERKRVEIETQLKTLELVERFIDDSENNYKTIPTLGVIDQGLVSIITEYNSLMLGYERIERSTTEVNPARINMQAQLASTKQSIKSSVGNVKKAMNVSKDEIDKQIATVSSRIVSVPTQERGLLQIMRQQTVKESLYLYLMKVKEETNITKASTSDKAKIITDPIIPEKASSPRLSIIVLVFMLLALIIPVALIYIKGLLQLNITSREELVSLSTTTIIGEIMKKGNDDGIIVVKDNVTTPIVELFRALRNNLQFTLGDSGKNVILVTSTIPGEGKTFISINLATTYALSEKRILLLGMDIRNPRLATDIGFAKGVGLTSYLQGSEKDWRSLVSKIDGYPSLDIIQAGIIPPNPNELLMKPALKQLLSEARLEYDVVIIDSAPVGVVSDTFLIGTYSDTTIYVTRENVTPKNAVKFLNEINEEKRLPNIYVVINGVEMTKNKGRHGRYGYGYSYGYGSRK